MCDRNGDDYKGDNPCPGCAQVDARDGVLICERCYRRLRRHLEDAADIVGHLRSIADPTKAAAFDRIRVQSSSIEIPAPVAADLIDASNDITTTLNMWANHVAGEDRPGAGLPAGATADAAHDVVQLAVDVILEDLDSLANDSHQVYSLCEGVMVVHKDAPDVWTVADAAVRWPLEDAPRWAQAACPACDLMAVRVQPGRSGRPSRYRCTTPECEWGANANDDGGLWASVFAEPSSPEILPHDPTLLTLVDAARLVHREPGTVRGWVKAGDIEPHLGRYRTDDVLAVAARKRGQAA
ncbi:helix-turn-helix domain-containing protein [Microbacterium oxydans]|nr:helix-turn-helix domain-containing protein [Microbacterium sp. B19(2022)]